MKLRIISDCHVENTKGAWPPGNLSFYLPPIEGEKDHVLVLAGDITSAPAIERTLPFFEEASERFRDVIYVMGNHEAYRSNWNNYQHTIGAALKPLSNVHLLTARRPSVDIDDVTFVGSTLWTDYKNADPIEMYNATRFMMDYKVIGGPDPGTKLWPATVLAQHYTERALIFEKAKEAMDAGRKVCVVTHHAPSSKSVHERYIGDPGNYAFYTELGDQLLDSNIPLWIHGHMHDPFDYTVGNTRVICNPFGYPHERDRHNPKLVIDF